MSVCTVFENLGALRSGIVDWLAEDQLDQNAIDRAVVLTEADIRRKLRVFQFEVTTELVIREETLTVPSRFLSMVRAYIPGYRPLENVSQEQLIIEQSECPGIGRPRHFTIEGREDALPFMRFSPFPANDLTFDLRLTYNADPGLQTNDDFNDILLKWPDIYFYGALVHLAAYMGNQERLVEWREFYANAIDSLIISDVSDKIAATLLTPRASGRIA